MTKQNKARNPMAFPRPIGFNGLNEYSEGQKGMTLRDYFAGQIVIGASGDYQFSPGDIAERAYRIADAMLEYRDNKEGGKC